MSLEYGIMNMNMKRTRGVERRENFAKMAGSNLVLISIKFWKTSNGFERLAVFYDLVDNSNLKSTAFETKQESKDYGKNYASNHQL